MMRRLNLLLLAAVLGSSLLLVNSALGQKCVRQ